MLLAFVIGGLAAAIAAPVLLSSGQDEEVPEPEDATDDTASLESLLVQGGEAHEEIAHGADEIHVLEDFQPGIDTFDVELDDPDVVIETGWGEDGVPYFTADTGDGILTARFPGLSEVPGDDVTFTVASSENEPPVSLTLTQVLDLGAVGQTAPQVTLLDGGEEHPLDPVFGIVDSTFDDLGALSPVSPEAADVPDAFPDLPPDLVPLAPETGDAPQTAPEPLADAVSLDPASGDVRDV